MNCFNCGKKFGLTSFKLSQTELWHINSHLKVASMNPDDRLCNACKRLFEDELYPRTPEYIQPNKKIKVEQSTKSIKIIYYFSIFIFIFIPIAIIYGLMTEDTIQWVSGIIVLTITLIQFPNSKKKFDGLSKTDDESLTVLKMRLAKGEITKEEFDRIKEDLRD